jgi:hypothetical protein
MKILNKLPKYIISSVIKQSEVIIFIDDESNKKTTIQEKQINCIRPHNFITRINNQIIVNDTSKYTLNYLMYYDKNKLHLLSLIYNDKYNENYVISKHKNKLICRYKDKNYPLKGRNELRLKLISFGELKFENRMYL